MNMNKKELKMEKREENLNELKKILTNTKSIAHFHHRYTEKFEIISIFAIQEDYTIIDITLDFCNSFGLMRNSQFRLMIKRKENIIDTLNKFAKLEYKGGFISLN
jgi:hypothetical protein